MVSTDGIRNGCKIVADPGAARARCPRLTNDDVLRVSDLHLADIRLLNLLGLVGFWERRIRNLHRMVCVIGRLIEVRH